MKLADTQAIAFMLSRPPSTIRTWARRYPSQLPRHGTRNGRALYNPDDAKQLAAALNNNRPVETTPDLVQH